MAGTPASLSPSTSSFISEISGEITTVVPPRSTAGGLVTERLSAAGGHDHERIAAVEHGRHRLLLERSKFREAPLAANRLAQFGKGQGMLRTRHRRDTRRLLEVDALVTACPACPFERRRQALVGGIVRLFVAGLLVKRDHLNQAALSMRELSVG